MLIKNIDTLRTFIPTIVGEDFNRYSTWLKGADRWLTREIIGTSLFELIDTEGDQVPEDQHLTLLGYCQSVCAFKGYIDAIPFLDLIETENGFGIVSNGNIAPASKDRVQALIEQTKKAFSDACEDLIRYLEETEAYHTDWKQSKAYSYISDCLIHTLDEFNRYAAFFGNRLDFVKVRPIMLKIQKIKIESVLGSELITELITELRSSGGLSDPNKLIIDLLRFSLAFYTLDDKAYKSIIITNPYERKADESIEKDGNGESFLLEARKIIMADLDSYPAFRDSKVYEQYLANVKTFSADDPFMVAGA